MDHLNIKLDKKCPNQDRNKLKSKVSDILQRSNLFSNNTLSIQSQKPIRKYCHNLLSNRHKTNLVVANIIIHLVIKWAIIKTHLITPSRCHLMRISNRTITYLNSIILILVTLTKILIKITIRLSKRMRCRSK